MDDRYLNRLLLFFLLMLASVTLAQPAELEPFTPFDGAIAAAGATQTWSFRGVEGEVVSLLARGESNDFDPILSLSNSAGTVLVANDDYAYPGSRDALLQAVTLPRTDTYTVTVSGFEDSTGTYTLTLFFGYADLQAFLNFNSPVDSWESDEGLTVDDANGTLSLSAQGIATGGAVVEPSSRAFDDFYARVLVENVEGVNGWNVGLTLRHQDSGYYVLMFNQRGQWRFVQRQGDNERVVRDWTNHPAIVAGEARFSIGVLAHGAGFDVFYNEAFVGQVVDSENALPQAGQIGFYARTNDALNSTTLVQFDDFTLTLPLKLGTADIIPTQLVPGGQALTIQELERRRVIPSGGAIGLNVAQSSGRQIAPGVNRIVFSRGTQFNDMVLSTFFTVTAARGSVVGCGVLFNHVDENSYTLAYLDQTGGYGLSTRDGETFTPGLFNLNPAWAGTARQHLLIVRLGDQVDYYVNRQHIGRMQIPAQAGEVGAAVVNYESIDTNCQFTDTWVWRLNG